MCWIRRVYFSCGHEDINVTPPRPIAPCWQAILRGSVANPIRCAPAYCKRRSPNDKDEDIRRDRPCVRCEQKELRESLDKEWGEFVKNNAATTTTSEMLFYMEERDKIFEDVDNHYWDWDQLQGILLEKCKEDIKAKHGSVGGGEQEAPASSSESSPRKQRHMSTQNHRHQ
ncbi:hypothetical protein F4818DRAFT_440620 [Hypoxylon cercidicola]|nr:hypothetical protein F4818DRAFT_440620 [Hypoxylon cercidicola]